MGHAKATKGCAAMVALCVLGLSVPAVAQTAQLQLDLILQEHSSDRNARRRSACATGQAPSLAASSRAAGIESPSAGAWCVTVLTRAARDGALAYVRDPKARQLTPAIAFDNGFVGGYQSREALPADAPAMATLLPIADRCLDQSEPNTSLCTAVGQLLGSRAARGEVITLR